MSGLVNGKKTVLFKNLCMETIHFGTRFCPSSFYEERPLSKPAEESTWSSPVRWSLWNLTRYLTFHGAGFQFHRKKCQVRWAPHNGSGSHARRGFRDGLSREEYANAPKIAPGPDSDLPAMSVEGKEVGEPSG